MADGGPDELYTLRAQYTLGHYALAVQEAKQVSRRPMSVALKLEREEYQMRSFLALRQYDKCTSPDDNSMGLQAIALQAQYEAAAGDGSAQKKILDQLKTLAATGGTTAQLVAAQACLSAGETAAAYALVAEGSTQEQIALKLQIYLKIDRLDLAKKELQNLQKDEESVLAELCSVYIHLYQGASMASEAEHSLNSLSEQYGPSVFLLNLLACTLAMQGDYAAAETKLQEAMRDFAEIQPQHESCLNLIAVLQQQGKPNQEFLDQIIKTTKPTATSLNFVENLNRVTSAFDREALKYK